MDGLEKVPWSELRKINARLSHLWFLFQDFRCEYTTWSSCRNQEHKGRPLGRAIERGMTGCWGQEEGNGKWGGAPNQDNEEGAGQTTPAVVV